MQQAALPWAPSLGLLAGADLFGCSSRKCGAKGIIAGARRAATGSGKAFSSWRTKKRIITPTGVQPGGDAVPQKSLQLSAQNSALPLPSSYHCTNAWQFYAFFPLLCTYCWLFSSLPRTPVCLQTLCFGAASPIFFWLGTTVLFIRGCMRCGIIFFSPRWGNGFETAAEEAFLWVIAQLVADSAARSQLGRIWGLRLPTRAQNGLQCPGKWVFKWRKGKRGKQNPFTPQNLK